MKYIRTNQSINPVYREEDIELFKLTNQKLGDTIEELCDEFVVWQEGCNMPIEMPLTEKEQYEKEYWKCNAFRCIFNVFPLLSVSFC